VFELIPNSLIGESFHDLISSLPCIVSARRVQFLRLALTSNPIPAGFSVERAIFGWFR